MSAGKPHPQTDQLTRGEVEGGSGEVGGGGGRARDVRGVRPARVLIAPSPAVFVREHVQANLSPWMYDQYVRGFWRGGGG